LLKTASRGFSVSYELQTTGQKLRTCLLPCNVRADTRVRPYEKMTHHKPQATFLYSPDEAAKPLRSGVHAGREAGVRLPPMLKRKGSA